MSECLFVYGTLRRDTGNGMFRFLARHARFVGKARIRGRLYDLGDYPGAVLSNDDDRWVRGEVYALENAGDVLSRLDRYEGCGPDDREPHEFERVMREAKFEDGRTGQTWVYAYKGPLDDDREILSGEYPGRAPRLRPR